MKKGEFNLFKCDTCEDKTEYESDAFMEHLYTVHNVPKGTQMTRQMIMHLDAQEFFETQYLWEWRFSRCRFASCAFRCRSHFYNSFLPFYFS